MIDKSEKFSLLVRVGYAARGLVYLLLGYLALTSAGDVSAGPAASFDVIQAIPLGSLVLYVTALGLLAYALYRFIAAVGDVEHQGSEAKGIARRVGYFVSGLTHTVLAWTALQFAQGNKQSSTGGGSEKAAGTLLAWDLGPIVLGVVGLALVAAAVFQGRSAITASFKRRVGGGAPPAVRWMGQAGYAARAVVFLLVGWSLIKSAWLGSQAEVKGFGQALMSMRENDAVYAVVAIGLLMFGVFSLIVARYRIIPDVQRSDLKPSLR
ncbi:MAG: DUF1206 domain-containing protein [Novosphingobium sp.]